MANPVYDNYGRNSWFELPQLEDDRVLVSVSLFNQLIREGRKVPRGATIRATKTDTTALKEMFPLPKIDNVD